jgi:hypothetical protein
MTQRNISRVTGLSFVATLRRVAVARSAAALILRPPAI